MHKHLLSESFRNPHLKIAMVRDEHRDEVEVKSRCNDMNAEGVISLMATRFRLVGGHWPANRDGTYQSRTGLSD